jgi:hypothetical protein
MSLENKYQQADAAQRAKGMKIRAAIASFLKLHPECPRTEQAEKIMFAAMESPENDWQDPTNVASWEDIWAQCRNKLETPPAARKQTPRRAAPPTTGLTRAEVDSWSSKELQRQMESSQRRSEEINAALSR